MHSDNVTQLYNDICSKLLSADWDKDGKDMKIAVKAYIENPNFLNNLHKIIENMDYSCSSVLTLCQSLMNELAQDNIPSKRFWAIILLITFVEYII